MNNEVLHELIHRYEDKYEFINKNDDCKKENNHNEIFNVVGNGIIF